MSAMELLKKLLLVAAVADVIANVVGVGEREDDEIVSFAIAKCARARGLGLFVFRLSVNNRGGRFAGIFAHAFPNAHHVAAGRIDDLAAAIFDLLQDRQFRSESGHDNDVVRLQIGYLRLLIMSGQILDAQRSNLLIDLRIVNDFPDDKKPAIFKNFARGVSEINGAFYPIAKAKLLGQAHGRLTRLNDSAGTPNLVDNVAQ